MNMYESFNLISLCFVILFKVLICVHQFILPSVSRVLLHVSKESSSLSPSSQFLSTLTPDSFVLSHHHQLNHPFRLLSYLIFTDCSLRSNTHSSCSARFILRLYFFSFCVPWFTLFRLIIIIFNLHWRWLFFWIFSLLCLTNISIYSTLTKSDDENQVICSCLPN